MGLGLVVMVCYDLVCLGGFALGFLLLVDGFVELTDVQVWLRVVVGFGVVSWFHLQAFFCVYLIVFMSL